MIRLEEVDFSYREGEKVLFGLSLDLPPGLTLLIGPNGSGKSTLMKLAAGIERPDRGRVSIGGLDLWREEVAARRRLAYVSEQPDLTPYATIMDVLRLVCRLRRESVTEARRALEQAGLEGCGDRSIRELSMGQRRRAVVAAAWIGSPQVLILDEPLEAMDRAMREKIVSWIDRALADQCTVLIATHDIEPFAPSARRAVAMRDGRCRLLDPLPADAAPRIAQLDALSRGLRPGIGGQ
ncbi:MAG: ABC transporter ATP-binding protein [Acidobacteria bacterium]|nr:ABC transporter ATP-binding protein [Acidobacteriota bacterium]